VFLVWRRPLDGVARLLGLALVGTAAAFNLQAHSVFATVDTAAPGLHAIVPIHWVLHAVSGAAYLHALVVFPNGAIVPRRLVWLVRLAYLFMAKEIALTFVTGSVGLLAVPFQLLFEFRGVDPVALRRPVRGAHAEPPGRYSVEFAPDAVLIAYFEQHPAPLAVLELDQHSPAVARLHASGVTLLAPLVTQGRLVGLLGLGEPASGGVYSADDRRFLSALAAEAAPAVRIAQLLASERARARVRHRRQRRLAAQRA
jgi:GAF domain-containing protein